MRRRPAGSPAAHEGRRVRLVIHGGKRHPRPRERAGAVPIGQKARERCDSKAGRGSPRPTPGAKRPPTPPETRTGARHRPRANRALHSTASFRLRRANPSLRPPRHARCNALRCTFSGSGLLDRSDFDDFRHVVPQHIFDPHFQGRGRTRAARARTLHMQVDDAILEILEHDITTVLRHGGPNARVEQFLDLSDDFVIGLSACVRRPRRSRIAGCVVLHDAAQDRGLQQLPVAVGLFGDGHEVGAEEHAARLDSNSLLARGERLAASAVAKSTCPSPGPRDPAGTSGSTD